MPKRTLRGSGEQGQLRALGIFSMEYPCPKCSAPISVCVPYCSRCGAKNEHLDGALCEEVFEDTPQVLFQKCQRPGHQLGWKPEDIPDLQEPPFCEFCGSRIPIPFN